MKNKKKNRSSYSLSAELKNALKYLLIWGMILIFSAYLLSDSEILGNVKQQARPDPELAGQQTDHIVGGYHVLPA